MGCEFGRGPTPSASYSTQWADGDGAGLRLGLVLLLHDASKPIVKYYPDSQALTIEIGRPQVDGETIADGVVVYYDAEDSNLVSGIYMYDAEALLKPLIDAVLARGRTATVEAPRCLA